MQRRQFGCEFKIEAVRLIKDRRASVAQASRDLAERPRNQPPSGTLARAASLPALLASCCMEQRRRYCRQAAGIAMSGLRSQQS